MYLFKLWFIILFIGYLIGQTAFAAKNDYLHCTKAINFYEERYKLPRNLLHSIATVESGRWNAEHKRVLPWPWTLNVAGKAYYFSTKQEAVDFLKSVLERGIEQVDVGCAQINWYYHGKKHFKKPEHAFNPVFNTAYAAHFLSQNYEKTKDWSRAIAIYHSNTREKGKNYASKVYKIWRNNRLGSKVGFDQKKQSNKVDYESRTYHQIIIDRDLNSDIMVRTSLKETKTIVMP